MWDSKFYPKTSPQDLATKRKINIFSNYKQVYSSMEANVWKVHSKGSKVEKLFTKKI